MTSDRPTDRFHGRIRGSHRSCAHPGCLEAGEFRAPDLSGRATSANGPGDYQFLCLDHVRAFNARYDWFTGMSADEIFAAQSPIHAWASETRAFRPTAGVDSPPKWADFHDPLDAISARFKGKMEAHAPARSANGNYLSADEKKALEILGLGTDADLKMLRASYSALVRKYHPDKNGGDRSFEKKLQAAVDAYQLLRGSPAFAK
jgi:hypothetical protein